MTSPYLNRPLRTLAEILLQRQCEDERKRIINATNRRDKPTKANKSVS